MEHYSPFHVTLVFRHSVRYPIALSTFRSATGNSGLFNVIDLFIKSINHSSLSIELIMKFMTLNRAELPVADRNVLRAMGYLTLWRITKVT